MTRAACGPVPEPLLIAAREQCWRGEGERRGENRGLAFGFELFMTDVWFEQPLRMPLNLHSTCENIDAWRVYTTPDQA